MIEIPVDQPLNKGLEQGLLFGTPPVDEPPAFTVRVGDAPLARRLRSLFERFGKPPRRPWKSWNADSSSG